MSGIRPSGTTCPRRADLDAKVNLQHRHGGAPAGARAPQRVHPNNAEQHYRSVRISVYRGAWDPVPAGTISIAELIRLLREPTAARAALVRAIRVDAAPYHELRAAGAGPKDPRVRKVKKRLDEKKRRLTAVTIGGVFDRRRALDEPYTPSGLTVVDIDKLEPDEAEALRAEGGQLPGCRTAFISPSGHGVKYIVKLAPTPRDSGEHDAATVQVMHAFAALLSRTVDPSGRDISRLCYLSVDPDTAVWEDNAGFEWNRDEQPAGANESAPAKPAARRRRPRYADAGRNNELYVGCMQAKNVHQLLKAIARAGALGLDDAETWRTVRSALKRRLKDSRLLKGPR